jgi:hypothetical protein
MSAALLVRLEHLGVSVEHDDGRLLLDGPEDVLTDDLIAEITAAKPALLAVLGADDGRQTFCRVAGDPTTPWDETDAPLVCIFHPDRTVAEGYPIACPDYRGRLDTLDEAGRPVVVTRPVVPWSCYLCRSTGRMARPACGDWTCASCGVIVAGPDETERPWRLVRRYGPVPVPTQPRVVWGQARGYLAVHDPATDTWHEIAYRDAPAVWQAAVRSLKSDR